MQGSHTWVICETTGRWAAALRVASARNITRIAKPRIHEIRNLTEFERAIAEHAPPIALLEVRPENLAAALSLLAQLRSSRVLFVALLEFVDARPAGGQIATDGLLEAGAAVVLTSTRQFDVVFQLAGRQAAICRGLAATDQGPQNFTKRAWAALPWQDA